MPVFESYGDGIPGVSHDELKGWLIVIEGTDGVGRSTQMKRLRAHLVAWAEPAHDIAAVGTT